MPNTLPISLYTERDVYLSDTLLDFVQGYNPGYIVYDGLEPGSASAHAGDGVFTTFPTDKPGHPIPTFYNDWYFRIHMVPAELALGNLLSNQSREVLLWNAYFESKTVSSFALLNGDGISVEEPQPTPFNMAPLGTYIYTVTVNTEGPPTIDAEMTWIIDGEGYTIPITGRRAVVWVFGPNWAQPVDETLEWMTAIETSRSRTEHRIEQRGVPRRVLEYRAQIISTDTGLYESAMFGWSDRLFALPLWQEKAITTLAASIDDTLLALPTADRSFAVDGLLVLFKSSTVYEAIEIASVDDGTITLKKGLELDWPAGSRVFPVMVAKLDGAANAAYVAEDKLEVPVRFVGSPAETPVRIPDEPADVTYEGIEVYTEGTNWISALDVSIQADVNTADSQYGVFTLRQRSGWPVVTKTHQWLSKSRAEGTTLRGYLGRRKGRLAPVWMPTGTADFKLLEDVVQTDTALRVVDNAYGQLVAGHPARKHVLIQVRGGTNIVREIDSVLPQGDGTAELLLTEAVGVDFTVKQLRRISYLGRYRMASDSVTISHKTTAASVVQASLQLTRPADTTSPA